MYIVLNIQIHIIIDHVNGNVCSYNFEIFFRYSLHPYNRYTLKKTNDF